MELLLVLACGVINDKIFQERKLLDDLLKGLEEVIDCLLKIITPLRIIPNTHHFKDYLIQL